MSTVTPGISESGLRRVDFPLPIFPSRRIEKGFLSDDVVAIYKTGVSGLRSPVTILRVTLFTQVLVSVLKIICGAPNRWLVLPFFTILGHSSPFTLS